MSAISLDLNQDHYDAKLAAVLAAMPGQDPLFLPTNFWNLGVRTLLSDWYKYGGGVEKFKSWTSAHSFFYPIYGYGLRQTEIDQVVTKINELVVKRHRNTGRFNALMNGRIDAERDFDMAQAIWNHDRWPMDFNFGESRIGQMPQAYSLLGQGGPVFGRPLLNYLLCLAALSNHVEAPPKTVLEIGGGFGVLGEIMLKSDPEAHYLDVDIPPLTVVADYYLSNVFPGEDRAKSIPSWEFPDVKGPFDLFVNSYSFQEMEPHVVANYISMVAANECRYILSLNTTEGKRVLDPDNPGSGGVNEPVTTAFIESEFAAAGYRTVYKSANTVLKSSASLMIMERF